MSVYEQILQGRIHKRFVIGCVCVVGGGGGGVGSVEPIFDFHGKFWINLINLGHFSFHFSSISLFYYM